MQIYHTQKNLNKPIRFMGFTSVQVGLIFAGLVVTLMVVNISFGEILLTLLAVAIYGTCIGLVAKKLNQEIKKNGIANYLDAYLTYGNTPKTIIDRKKYFKYLIK